MKSGASRTGLALLPAPFNKLSDFDQQLIKQTGTLLEVKKGESVLKAGEQSRYGYYLQSGWCSVSVEGYVAELLAPKSTFLASLSMNTPAWAEVVALSKATLYCYELNTLHDIVMRNPQLAILFMETTLQRLARAHIFYALKGSQPLEQRLADVLWHVSTVNDDGSRTVPASLTQTVLASLLGSTREEVSRRKQLLIKTGYLYQEGSDWLLDAMTPMMLSNIQASLSGRQLLR
jgi:CRP-like cAMP-binding protein